MSDKLRLGPLTMAEVVRLTVVIPAAIKSDLDRYAELYGAAYSEAVDAAALVPHMLAAFMERDRAFRPGRQPARAGSSFRSGSRLSDSSAVSSSTSDTAGEGSSR